MNNMDYKKLKILIPVRPWASDQTMEATLSSWKFVVDCFHKSVNDLAFDIEMCPVSLGVHMRVHTVKNNNVWSASNNNWKSICLTMGW